jgi:hypothetical protein
MVSIPLVLETKLLQLKSKQNPLVKPRPVKEVG